MEDPFSLSDEDAHVVAASMGPKIDALAAMFPKGTLVTIVVRRPGSTAGIVMIPENETFENVIEAVRVAEYALKGSSRGH